MSSSCSIYRKIIIDVVKPHEGRVGDSHGDNVLAELPSEVDTGKCAVQIQIENTERNETLPENRKMKFRIGVNPGDIAENGDFNEATAYHPKLKLKRTKTLMHGHDL